jgi:polyhydroxybutyrate depolymerase
MNRPARLSALVLLAASASAVETGLLTRSTTWQGRTRTWTAYVPAAAATNPTRLRRVAFCLHGTGGTAASMRSMIVNGFDALAEADDIVVVYPDGVDNAWNDDRPVNEGGASIEDVDDVGLIGHLADLCAAEWNADRNRILATGFSNGGGMTVRLARELNARMGAVAPFEFSTPSATLGFGLPAPLPIMLVNSTADPIALFGGGTRNAGTPQEYTTAAVEDVVAFYVAANGAGAAQTTDLPDISTTDGSTVQRRFHAAGGSGTAAVQFWKITGGGHTWAGGTQYLPATVIGKVCRDFNGCAAVWDFWTHYARPAPRYRTIRITTSLGARIWRTDVAAPYSGNEGATSVFTQLDPDSVQSLAIAPAGGGS